MLLSVTHARLRAQQGDAKGAAAILRELLAHRPQDREAADLLASLPAAGTEHAEPVHSRPQPPTPAEAGALAASFRRALGRGNRTRALRGRLQKFLAAVTRHAR